MTYKFLHTIMPSMRAFIAVPISDEVKKNIEPFRKALEIDDVKTVEPENLHITLFFLGEIDERRTMEIIAAMEKINAERFELPFSGAGVFPNPNFIRVVWVGCESKELENIYGALAPSISKMGYKFEDFRAHLTIARVKGPAAKEKVKEVIARFKDAKFGACTVDRIVLFKSTLTPKGPIYEEVFAKMLR